MRKTLATLIATVALIVGLPTFASATTATCGDPAGLYPPCGVPCGDPAGTYPCPPPPIKCGDPAGAYPCAVPAVCGDPAGAYPCTTPSGAPFVRSHRLRHLLWLARHRR